MIEREIDPEVLVTIADMTPKMLGDVRPVVQVEDVVRRLLDLEDGAAVPGTKNAFVALALKDLRKKGLVTYGSHLRDVNLGYHVTDKGQEVADGIKAALERRRYYEKLRAAYPGAPEVSSHKFKPLARFRNRGRCEACLAHEKFHPTPGYVPARALGEKSEAFLP